MTKDEALRLALEALETSMYPQQKQLQAITAIKAALEAKDEPVIDKSAAKRIATQLGWEPPRTPISDEDIRQAEHHMVCGAYDYSFKQGVKWAEKAHGIKWEWER